MNDKQKLAEKLVSEARKGSPWSPRSIILYLLAIIWYAIRLLRRGK